MGGATGALARVSPTLAQRRPSRPVHSAQESSIAFQARRSDRRRGGPDGRSVRTVRSAVICERECRGSPTLGEVPSEQATAEQIAVTRRRKFCREDEGNRSRAMRCSSSPTRRDGRQNQAERRRLTTTSAIARVACRDSDLHALIPNFVQPFHRESTYIQDSKSKSQLFSRPFYTLCLHWHG